jgi:hypothetical protein
MPCNSTALSASNGTVWIEDSRGGRMDGENTETSNTCQEGAQRKNRNKTILHCDNNTEVN